MSRIYKFAVDLVTPNRKKTYSLLEELVEKPFAAAIKKVPELNSGYDYVLLSPHEMEVRFVEARWNEEVQTRLDKFVIDFLTSQWKSHPKELFPSHKGNKLPKIEKD